MAVSFAEFRLPPGHHGLSPEEVAENQRWRLLGAAAEVLTERGYLSTTTAGVARCASVSRTTFYAHFDDLSSCLLAAHVMAADCVVDVVANACEEELKWELRLRAAVDAVLEFLAEEPALASLLGSELAAGVPQVAIARTNLVERLRPLLGASQHDGDGSPPYLAAAERHLIAGALSLVSDRISEGGGEDLDELARALFELLASPYRVVLSGSL